jgi:hypothetical protein
VKSARAEAQRAEYRDGHTRGLVHRVTPNGAKTWAVVYRRRSDSRRRRYAIGAYPAFSLTEASPCIGYEDESTQVPENGRRAPLQSELSRLSSLHTRSGNPRHARQPPGVPPVVLNPIAKPEIASAR